MGINPLSFFVGFLAGFLIGAWVVPCMQVRALVPTDLWIMKVLLWV